HAPAQLDRLAVALQVEQVLDLTPVRYIDRPQIGLAHTGQFGRRPGYRHIPAGAGPRFGQARHFQPAIGLLHGPQADAVFAATRPYGRQAAAGFIQALLDAVAEGVGETEITAH